MDQAIIDAIADDAARLLAALQTKTRQGIGNASAHRMVEAAMPALVVFETDQTAAAQAQKLS